MFGSRVNHYYNVGVPTHWSPGDSPASHRPSGLVWRSDGYRIRGTRRPLLPRKIHSEDDIKVTGARGGEHCLCGKILIYLGEP